ncbi:MAG TPA: HD domain-containing protein, partial [Atopostipes sp.]|nr:HD domain-containing protein [Atopostipes sp.]
MKATEDFYKAYANIKRTGATEFLKWLEGTDFFTAPASTKFHGSHANGLVEHSVKVFERLSKMVSQIYDIETIALCSLLHDVCKANFYTVAMRNAKNDSTGVWEKKPYYTVDDQFPYGHGEKSVYLINKHMILKEEEAMAIRWHMGGFDETTRGGGYYLNSALEKYPMILYLH